MSNLNENPALRNASLSADLLPNGTRPDATAHRSVVATIQSIVSTAESDGAIWHGMLELIASQWDTPYAAVRIVTQRGMVQEERHQQGLPVEGWRLCVVPELTHAVVSGNERSQIFKDAESGFEIAIHTIPVTDQGGRPCGALSIVTDPLSAALCDATRAQLSLLIVFCSQAGWDPDMPLPLAVGMAGEALLSAGENDTRETLAPNAESVDFDEATRQATIAARYGSVEELAFHVTNSIKTRFNCIEVAMGLVKRRRVKLLAISGLDAVYRKTPGAMRISQAMEECLDHGGFVYAQDMPLQSETGKSLEMPIHQRLRSLTKGSNCVSISLGAEQSPTAILTLRRPGDVPFQTAELEELRSQFSAVADAINVLQVARRNIFTHAWDECASGCIRLMQTTHVRGVSVALSLVLVAWALMAHWAHSVYFEARFSSPKGRIYSAPIDGRIASVHVVPGQHIERGMLLFEIDTEELKRELNELSNQARQHRVRMVYALENYDPSSAAAANLLLEADMLAMKKIEERIQTAKVYAENAGVLIRGEGHLRVGERVPYGEAICQIAADASREIQLRLDDDQAGDLKVGMDGWFAAKGEPEKKLPIEIVRIESQTAVEDGRNLVSAWARLDETVETLPLGAEGYARIETGRKPGWWIAFHKPLRKLRWYLWPV